MRKKFHAAIKIKAVDFYVCSYAARGEAPKERILEYFMQRQNKKR
jgi:hypothetical protein